ncbi:MAG: response regulator [Flavisolibacter sp.]|jgi:CheY-like chemotaxis protein
MIFKDVQVHSILVIDDDRDDFELVSEAIREIDPEISVSFVNKCNETEKYRNKKFDLVLLDINMPTYDGFYWLKAIREKGFINLPVIMYTNSLSPANINRAYKEGANLYFSKPENFSLLVKSLREIVKTDWSEPFRITRKYTAHGNNKIFQLS